MILDYDIKKDIDVSEYFSSSDDFCAINKFTLNSDEGVSAPDSSEVILTNRTLAISVLEESKSFLVTAETSSGVKAKLTLNVSVKDKEEVVVNKTEVLVALSKIVNVIEPPYFKGSLVTTATYDLR